jgi:NADP-dependent 3-hydroxy acid dehydrogenase YdfG
MPGSIRTLNLREWDKCININVRSVFMVVSLATPFLKLSKDENPSVCILSGLAGEKPYPGFTVFSV